MNCKIKEQQGHILPIMLFLLSCTMLWSSLFLLALSDQQAASNTCIRQEQSRLLAYSGWNLALQQLENGGGLEPILLENPAGQLQVQLEQLSSWAGGSAVGGHFRRKPPIWCRERCDCFRCHGRRSTPGQW